MIGTFWRNNIRHFLLAGIGLISASSLFSQTNIPFQTPTPPAGPPITASPSTTKTLTLNEAIDLAIQQASNYRSAQFDELGVREDVTQSRAAFKPKISAPLNLIYTSPSAGQIQPRPPSYLGANAISEFQALITAAGEIDTSGKLSATLRKNQALLEAAGAGTEVAKRDLIQAVVDAYFNLALATTRRRGAESTLEATVDFEGKIKLNVDAGEVAPIDLVRARLQTAVRRDEMEQARLDEVINSNALRFLIGRDVNAPIETVDLLTQLPIQDEIGRFSQATIQTRPEFSQFQAFRRSIEEDVKIARSERRPQLTYSIGGGFISDSLRASRIHDQAGIQAIIGFTIPIFDWGASRSRETQARIKLQQTDNLRLMTERQFTQDFFAARAQANSAQERINLLSVSIKDAETNINVSVARYRAGEAPISEVVDAQNLLISQKQSLYKAIFDYQTAKARLARAAGQ